MFEKIVKYCFLYNSIKSIFRSGLIMRTVQVPHTKNNYNYASKTASQWLSSRFRNIKIQLFITYVLKAIIFVHNRGAKFYTPPYLNKRLANVAYRILTQNNYKYASKQARFFLYSVCTLGIFLFWSLCVVVIFFDPLASFDLSSLTNSFSSLSASCNSHNRKSPHKILPFSSIKVQSMFLNSPSLSGCSDSLGRFRSLAVLISSSARFNSSRLNSPVMISPSISITLHSIYLKNCWGYPP